MVNEPPVFESLRFTVFSFKIKLSSFLVMSKAQYGVSKAVDTLGTFSAILNKWDTFVEFLSTRLPLQQRSEMGANSFLLG